MAIPVCGAAHWFLKAIIRRKKGSPKVVSIVFPYKFLQIQIASVYGHGMPVVCTTYSKCVKSLQAWVWSVNFTIFKKFSFLAGFWRLAQVCGAVCVLRLLKWPALLNSDLLKHLASIRILAGHHVNVEKLLKNHFFLVNKKIFVTANPFLEGHKIACDRLLCTNCSFSNSLRPLSNKSILWLFF
jgi:hypothetical protein